jgi:hypothetical protein
MLHRQPSRRASSPHCHNLTLNGLVTVAGLRDDGVSDACTPATLVQPPDKRGRATPIDSRGPIFTGRPPEDAAWDDIGQIEPPLQRRVARTAEPPLLGE